MIRLVPDEAPFLWRFLCDDGQLVEVVAHSDNLARRTALEHFEANTVRVKPAKGSQVWVSIVGAARLELGTVEQLELPPDPGRHARTPDH